MLIALISLSTNTLEGAFFALEVRVGQLHQVFISIWFLVQLNLLPANF